MQQHSENSTNEISTDMATKCSQCRDGNETQKWQIHVYIKVLFLSNDIWITFVLAIYRHNLNSQALNHFNETCSEKCSFTHFGPQEKCFETTIFWIVFKWFYIINLKTLIMKTCNKILNLTRIHTISLSKVLLKLSGVKWRSICLEHNKIHEFVDTGFASKG